LESGKAFEDTTLEHEAAVLRRFKLRRRLGLNLDQHYQQFGRIVTERSTAFDPRVVGAPDNSRLRGYFQSPKYFEHQLEIIVKEITSFDSPSPWYLAERQRLNTGADWIALHVRRGDYVSGGVMGVTDASYYSKALDLAESLTGLKRVIVFSDDIESAKSLPALRDRKTVEFFDSPAASSPLENLMLISSAKHFITANSTFSWWAAFLGKSSKKVVICPRPWLDLPGWNDRDLHPRDWITLGRS
jgi:hypothetical protein